MAWLQIDQTIRDHHKILDAADLLETTDAHVTGCLVLLWLWAIDNAPDGSLAGISDATIARAAKWSGERAASSAAQADGSHSSWWAASTRRECSCICCTRRAACRCNCIRLSAMGMPSLRQ